MINSKPIRQSRSFFRVFSYSTLLFFIVIGCGGGGGSSDAGDSSSPQLYTVNSQSTATPLKIVALETSDLQLGQSSYVGRIGGHDVEMFIQGDGALIFMVPLGLTGEQNLYVTINSQTYVVKLFIEAAPEIDPDVFVEEFAASLNDFIDQAIIDASLPGNSLISVDQLQGARASIEAFVKSIDSMSVEDKLLVAQLLQSNLFTDIFAQTLAKLDTSHAILSGSYESCTDQVKGNLSSALDPLAELNNMLAIDSEIDMFPSIPDEDLETTLLVYAWSMIINADNIAHELKKACSFFPVAIEPVYDGPTPVPFLWGDPQFVTIKAFFQMDDYAAGELLRRFLYLTEDINYTLPLGSDIIDAMTAHATEYYSEVTDPASFSIKYISDNRINATTESKGTSLGITFIPTEELESGFIFDFRIVDLQFGFEIYVDAKLIPSEAVPKLNYTFLEDFENQMNIGSRALLNTHHIAKVESTGTLDGNFFFDEDDPLAFFFTAKPNSIYHVTAWATTKEGEIINNTVLDGVNRIIAPAIKELDQPPLIDTEVSPTAAPHGVDGLCLVDYPVEPPPVQEAQMDARGKQGNEVKIREFYYGDEVELKTYEDDFLFGTVAIWSDSDTIFQSYSVADFVLLKAMWPEGSPYMDAYPWSWGSDGSGSGKIGPGVWLVDRSDIDPDFKPYFVVEKFIKPLDFEKGILKVAETEYDMATCKAKQYTEKIYTKENRESHSSGLFHGERISISDQGHYYIKHFEYGIRQGTDTMYWANGNPKYIFTYENGIKVGFEKHYYESGSINLEIPLIYIEGDVESYYHGTAFSYYESGVTRGYNNYDMGVLNGATRDYWPSGNLQTSGQYSNGNPVGTWTDCSEDGEDCNTYTL